MTKKNILIVEDDACIREALNELLTAEGYKVLLAEHGGVALNILKYNSSYPALILLDLSMPVMDGPTFLREIAKQVPLMQEIPVITMTAAAPADLPEGILTELTLRKPLEVEVLMDRIEKIIYQN